MYKLGTVSDHIERIYQKAGSKKLWFVYDTFQFHSGVLFFKKIAALMLIFGSLSRYTCTDFAKKNKPRPLKFGIIYLSVPLRAI